MGGPELSANVPALTQPFRALRPTPEHAADVIAPPYDVVDSDEARAIARDRPYDFLHVSRPEIDFPHGTDPYADAVYEHGGAMLRRLLREGVLIRESAPSYYVYRLSMQDHEQTGIGMTASVQAYDSQIIKRHELTTPVKENDRVRNIEALNAQTGPVLCAFRDDDLLRSLILAETQHEPLFAVVGPHAVRHTIWRVAEPSRIAAIARALNALDGLYIADGHHRSAAASRVAAQRRGRAAGPGGASSEYFLTVAFADRDLQILDYNRAVADLNSLSAEEFLAAVRLKFELAPCQRAYKPDAAGRFGMYLGGNWYRLTAEATAPAADPIAALDVSLLQERLIEPVLGIDDPRTDDRIEFIGGVRGLAALEERVDTGRAAVAFSLYPTSIRQLMAVADANALMPPKSTWFEPKLADGLLSHMLD
jgi:uncharacterized protein (DUF1015 family)